MQTILNTSDNPAHDSLVEKKSEFIGDAAHVDTLDEALAFVTSIREQHPKARHVAYAAVCGGADGRLSERMSDDESYAANVELTAVVPVDHCEQFELQVVEAFNAAVSPEPIDMVNIPVPLA